MPKAENIRPAELQRRLLTSNIAMLRDLGLALSGNNPLQDLRIKPKNGKKSEEDEDEIQNSIKEINTLEDLKNIKIPPNATKEDIESFLQTKLPILAAFQMALNFESAGRKDLDDFIEGTAYPGDTRNDPDLLKHFLKLIRDCNPKEKLTPLLEDINKNFPAMDPNKNLNLIAGLSKENLFKLFNEDTYSLLKSMKILNSTNTKTNEEAKEAMDFLHNITKTFPNDLETLKKALIYCQEKYRKNEGLNHFFTEILKNQEISQINFRAGTKIKLVEIIYTGLKNDKLGDLSRLFSPQFTKQFTPAITEKDLTKEELPFSPFEFIENMTRMYPNDLTTLKMTLLYIDKKMAKEAKNYKKSSLKTFIDVLLNNDKLKGIKIENVDKLNPGELFLDGLSRIDINQLENLFDEKNFSYFIKLNEKIFLGNISGNTEALKTKLKILSPLIKKCHNNPEAIKEIVQIMARFHTNDIIRNMAQVLLENDQFKPKYKLQPKAYYANILAKERQEGILAEDLSKLKDIFLANLANMNINHLTDIFDKDTEKLMHLLGIEKERNWFSRKNQLPELELIKKYCQSFPTVTENLVVILSTCQGDNEQPTKQLAENLLKNKKIKGSAVNVPSGLTIQKLFLDAITKEKLENIRNFMLDEKNDDFLMKTSQLVSENKINPKEFKKGIKILREIMDEVKDPAELKPALNWFQAKYSPHMDAIVSKLLENNALKNVTPAPGKGQAYYNKYFKTEPDRPWIRRIFSRNKSKTDPKKPGIDYI